MYLKLGQINIWPAREIVDQTMPEDFKVKYKYTPGDNLLYRGKVSNAK